METPKFHWLIDNKILPICWLYWNSLDTNKIYKVYSFLKTIKKNNLFHDVFPDHFISKGFCTLVTVIFHQRTLLVHLFCLQLFSVFSGNKWGLRLLNSLELGHWKLDPDFLSLFLFLFFFCYVVLEHLNWPIDFQFFLL